MSAKVGDRRGLLICARVEAPDFPSRWCRFLGHSWSGFTESSAGVPRYVSQTCTRCGAYQSWYHHDHLPTWYGEETT